jgi:hypothetical protein
MPNEILQKVGTQVRFCVSGSFNPVNAKSNLTIGTPTDVAITLASLASGSARQSAKADLGEKRPAAYAVMASVDFTGETPSDTGRIDFYWAPSTSVTTAQGNVAGNSGTDAVAPHETLSSSSLAEFVRLCQFVGSLTVHNDGTVHTGFIGIFTPSNRYGQLIVVNNSGDAFEDNDEENHVVFNPIVDEVQ